MTRAEIAAASHALGDGVELRLTLITAVLGKPIVESTPRQISKANEIIERIAAVVRSFPHHGSAPNNTIPTAHRTSSEGTP